MCRMCSVGVEKQNTEGRTKLAHRVNSFGPGGGVDVDQRQHPRRSVDQIPFPDLCTATAAGYQEGLHVIARQSEYAVGR